MFLMLHAKANWLQQMPTILKLGPVQLRVCKSLEVALSDFLCSELPIFLHLWTQGFTPSFHRSKYRDMDDLPSARALAHDMIYNGVEVHSVSIFLSVQLYIQANFAYFLNLF
jgi:hypothetical protein